MDNKIKVLSTEYLQNNMDFSNMDLVQALRVFCSRNPLPPEAQQIDRIIKDFSEKYWNNNPNPIFPDPDAVYMLSFAIIMLNTDLHTISIQKKMSKEDFRRMNRSACNGSDYPGDYLDKIYDSILANSIIINSTKEYSNNTDVESTLKDDQGFGNRDREEFLQEIESDDFEEGLFECFSDPESCLCSFCCPCIQLGRNMEAIGEGACFTWGALWFVIELFCKSGCVIHFLERSKVRDRLRMRPNPLMDLIYVSCCAGCSLAQEAREIKSRRERLYRI